MSDAVEKEMHCTPPELTQIATNLMQDLIPSNSGKVYDFLHNAPDEKYLATKVKFLSFLEVEL
jgi:hypothetical protein